MKFHIITIFPNIFDSYFKESILKRAQEKGLIAVVVHNLRDYTDDKHHTVDDSPYGGGPGMVLKTEPLLKAVQSLRGDRRKAGDAAISRKKSRVILFSTRGKKFDQKAAQRLAKYDQLIFICGRYEGVDERVAKYVADEELSVGDFVLAGGELPAMIVTEAVARFIPGVLGKEESLETIKGSYPTYTRPEAVDIDGKNRRVPKVLLSGDHKKIDEWRIRHSEQQ